MVLIWVVIRHDLTAGGWTGFSSRAWDRRGLARLFQVGWPIGVQMSLEVWAFQTATLLAGRLGDTALAAHSIVLNVE